MKHFNSYHPTEAVHGVELQGQQAITANNAL
jgi:hypothetical protein